MLDETKSIPTPEEVLDHIGQQMPGLYLRPIAGVYRASMNATEDGKLCSVTDIRTGVTTTRLYHIKEGRWQHFTDQERRDRTELLRRRWHAAHPIRTWLGQEPSDRDMRWLEFSLSNEEMLSGEWGSMTLGGGLINVRGSSE